MIDCQKCGRSNEDRYKFCLGCGAPLAKAPASPASPASQAPAPSTGAAFVQPLQPLSPYATNPPPRLPTPAQPAPPLPPAAPPRPVLSAPSLSPMPAYAPPPPTHSIPAPSAPSLSPMPAYAPPPAHSAPAPAPATKVCAQCGAASPAEFLFCGRCGTRFEAKAPSSPPPPPAPPQNVTTADAAQVRARLTLINPDGTAGGAVALVDGEAILGRTDTLPIFLEDPFVSPQHLRVTCTPGRVLVEDLDSPNGTFLQLGRDPLTLEQDDILRIGQQLLRFETLEAQEPTVTAAPGDTTRALGGPPPAAWGVLCRVVSRNGAASDRYMLTGAEQIIGRERGHVVFRLDGFASGQHARLAPAPDGSVTLQDLGSSNGTYLRLRGTYDACDGDLFLIGQRVFQLHIHDPA